MHQTFTQWLSSSKKITLSVESAVAPTATPFLPLYFFFIFFKRVSGYSLKCTIEFDFPSVRYNTRSKRGSSRDLQLKIFPTIKLIEIIICHARVRIQVQAFSMTTKSSTDNGFCELKVGSFAQSTRTS